MENKPDVWVPRDQHVMIGSCSRLSLTCDGTREGTHIDDAEDTCPDLHGLSVTGTTARLVPTTMDEARIRNTQKSMVVAGMGSGRIVHKSHSLLTFVFALLLPRAQASVHYHLDKESDTNADTRLHHITGRIESFAEKLKINWAQKASNQGVDGDVVADGLLAGIISSVCQRHFEGSSPRIFQPKILSDCVASIYSSQQLIQPVLRLPLVAGGSILCKYIVSESYPSGQEFLPDTCDRLQSLMGQEIRIDPSVTASISPAVQSSVAKAESLGISFHATSPNAEGLTQSIAPSSLPNSAPSKTGSATISSSSAASEGILPLKSLTDLLAAENLDSSALTSDTSQLVSLVRTESPVPKAPGASILQVSGLLRQSGFDPKVVYQATDRFLPRPSVFLASADTTSHEYIDLLSFAPSAYSSSTPSISEPRKLLDVQENPSQSVGRGSTLSLSTSRQTASLTAASFRPSEAVGIDLSTYKAAGVSNVTASNLLPESKHTVSKAPQAITTIRIQDDPLRSSSASRLELTPPLLMRSSFAKSDLSLSVSSKVKSTQINGVPLISSSVRTFSELAQSSIPILLNADFGDHGRPGRRLQMLRSTLLDLQLL